MKFGAVMIFCFSVSRPAAVFKTLRTQRVDGISILFMWFVFAGYLAGILFKVFEAQTLGHLSPVTVLYVFNTELVGTEVVLWYRFH